MLEERMAVQPEVEESFKPKRVQLSIINTVEAPFFPSTEWLNIIQGASVNLDIVSASINSSAVSNQHVTDIGNILELMLKGSDKLQTITQHRPWITVQTYTINAYKFVFPWHLAELTNYLRHISQLFNSTISAAHPQVAAYDCTV
ncbi:hypothetical protein CONPUDRAFT_157915 [Coniophora puteana RWD-64-598 SS2]|uniref:Uncharacterized protein n=1 Tax=Coniophora puteana (strain RWD-64-598) TaxID=741705 RepID=A0A5M3MDR7_CONPW|nr:uncharacterized protein CONPUDRAFT_157915 [Coniophora puteana RWD-64-598 SS2]EIW76745.1 hypothetical protein CONPUDRAFT_157915 [Coniophora puteana RWD-64-598 SS2]